MGSGGNDIPEPPKLPAPPAAPDMSPIYEIQVKNAQAQNEIARGMTDLAHKKMGIAEELRDRWANGYKGVEEKALKDVDRGVDPAITEAKARNDVMQQVGPAQRGIAAAMSRRGISPDSPMSMAAVEGTGVGLASEMGKRTIGARETTEKVNLANKANAVAIGSTIPSQVVQGYSGASGIMSGASNLMNASNQTMANALSQKAGMEYNTAMTNWKYQTDVAMMNYDYEVKKAMAESGGSNAAGGALMGAGATLLGVGLFMDWNPFGWAVTATGAVLIGAGYLTSQQ